MEDDNLEFMMMILNDVLDAEDDNDQPARRYRTPLDPFSLSDNAFIKLFRLNKEIVQQIINLLLPLLVQQTRASALPVETKILVVLNFLGHGSYQTITGRNRFFDISQASVSRCLNEVITCFNNPDIINQFIKFPSNMEALNNARQRFYNKFNFFGPVGVIDCTHVAIVAPNEDEHVFVNRKNYHSINVQLICDENLLITNVNARYPGSFHDSRIWSLSPLSNVMEEIYRQHPQERFFLMGDSGYPLRPWLLTPFRNPAPDSPEEVFNGRFTSIRSIIERCNGLLKARFRCLLKHRTLHYAPEKAVKIIISCCILHNICITNNIDIINDEVIDVQDADNHVNINEPVNQGSVNPDLAAGRNLKEVIMHEIRNQN